MSAGNKYYENDNLPYGELTWEQRCREQHSAVNGASMHYYALPQVQEASRAVVVM